MTKAKQDRIANALLLHDSQSHPPHAQLCHDLTAGKHPYSTVTPKDIIEMREYIGPCIHCLAGRGNRSAAIRLPSEAPPATNSGAKISFDPQQTPINTLGGFS